VGLWAAVTVSSALLLWSRHAFGQDPRSGVAVRLVQSGVRHSEEGRYRQAINDLEEAWEFDSSNVTVAEHLALSYLYEIHPPPAEAFSKAEKLMRYALEHGGQATVQARHLHKGWQWVTNMDDSCPGRFSVTSWGVHFLALDDLHSFTVKREQLREITLPGERSSNQNGVFTFETVDGTRYRMRTGTGTRTEARILVDLTREVSTGG
jgi:hypothetical protein